MEYVSYKKFGAAGDGKTNDAAAIFAAHKYANEHGLPVKSEEGAVFYISDVDERIVIQTDTDWTGSSFILDDREFADPDVRKKKNGSIFIVAPTEPEYTLEGLAPPKKFDNKLDITLGKPALILLYDNTQIRYKRSGGDANDGSAQTEIIIVDENGNVSPETPIMWDYNEVSSARVFPIDEKPLTLKGGKFTTIAPQKVVGRRYIERNISIRRSNVIVDGFEHYVENEDEMGSPYGGIFSINCCAHVTLKNCILTPRVYFRFNLPDGRPYGQGTYELSISYTASLTFENCRQTCNINDPKWWGIMGTNYCKNMVLRDCIFSRFDAHQGVANVSIYGCDLGYQGVETIGIGTVYVENSHLYGHNMIVLRPDYGSSWEGEIIIKNCRWTPSFGNVIASLRPVIGGFNKEDHDYGYHCCMPHTVTIDGLYIDDSRTTGDGGITVFTAFNPDHTTEEYEKNVKYPYTVAKTLKMRNITTASGKKPLTFANEFMFRNTEVIENF